MPSEYDPNETARDWEALQKDDDSTTSRLRIQGGWLYRNVTADNNAVALVYVPIASESTDD